MAKIVSYPFQCENEYRRKFKQAPKQSWVVGLGGLSVPQSRRVKRTLRNQLTGERGMKTNLSHLGQFAKVEINSEGILITASRTPTLGELERTDAFLRQTNKQKAS